MASSSKFPSNDFLSPPPQPPQQPPPPPTQPQPPSKTVTKPQKRPKTSPNNTNNILSPSESEVSLSKTSHLTRQELLKRRLHRLRKLSKVYRDHYWALLEDLRVRYRDYYWKYGVSPHDERERDIGGGGGGGDRDREFVEGCGETTNVTSACGGGGGLNVNVNVNVNGSGEKLGLGFGESANNYNNFFLINNINNRCASKGCKSKAMALTSFCHLHIVHDPHQKLYKACNFVVKSAQAGPILCGLPILKSTDFSICYTHIQKAQKHVTRALKKAGLSASSSTKLAPKFHVVISEYLNQIQSKRRAGRKADSKKISVKEEPPS